MMETVKNKIIPSAIRHRQNLLQLINYPYFRSATCEKYIGGGHLKQASVPKTDSEGVAEAANWIYCNFTFVSDIN
jgi:hypothetical protein